MNQMVGSRRARWTTLLTGAAIAVLSLGSGHVAHAEQQQFFVPLQPARLADTRTDGGTVDGLFAGGGKINAGGVVALTVGGRGGVPAGAEAADLNVTVVAPDRAGFVTVWPCGSPRPNASNLNYVAGETVPNAVFAALGDDGKVCIYTQAAAHLVVDVNGAFPAGSSFTPLLPQRLTDTRADHHTVDGLFAGTGQLTAGAVFELPVAGRGGVPADAAAAVLNVTATEPAGNGFLTVWPCGSPRPNVSSLNYSTGQTVANAVLVKLGAAGMVCFSSQLSSHLVVDVTGALPAGSPLVAFDSSRLADTRADGTTVDGQFAGIGKIAAGGVLELTVAGRNGVPLDAQAIALNVTTVDPDASGFMTVWPCGSPRPLASNMNYVAGTTRANAVIAEIGANGAVCFFAQSSTHLVVDSSGAFALPAPIPTPAPSITSVSPASGPEAGGTTVTITGTDFTGATNVAFGATPATTFTVSSPTELTAVAPAGTGTVDISITTTIGGTSATSATDRYTYVPAPTVTGISPTSGPETGGTTVTITGTNFTGAAAVRFGGTPATSFTVDSPTQITAVAPAETGRVDVTVATVGGRSATSVSDRFTYVPGPIVTFVIPSSGPEAGGTTVTIVGPNFTGATNVTFGATPAASFTVVTPNQISAVAPAGTGTVDIMVTTPSGTSPAGAADEYTYVPAPTVTGISPTSGAEAGGTSVTITGTNFTGATLVTFGGTPSPNFTVDSAAQITAVAPAGTGIVDVAVTTAGGTTPISSADEYTYVPAPNVSAVSPTSGPEAGGTTVTITGTNLTGAVDVSFGATPATGFTVVSATQITATAPAGTGTVDITVTSSAGTSATSAADQYTYIPAPAVVGISPTSGPTAGGTSVAITGTNLTGATSVAFGATPATSFTVDSSTQITATAPAGIGTVDITVTTTGGTTATSSADEYTYVPAPAVTVVSPNNGPVAGGTTVTITGTNLTGATDVAFGATPATSFTVVSATQITATAPAGTGTVDITVSTTGGTSTTSAADQYTYVPAPTVTSVSPASGPEGGGNTVTITGTGFTSTTDVAFGATPAAAFTVDSDTQITAITPAGVGTVDITVTTAGGTSATSAADQYTYIPAPTVTSVTPSAGPTSGGTSVTITGTGFTTADSVTFGGIPAAFVTISDTMIVAIAPANVPGAADVVVTTAGGSATVVAGYTYLDPP